jgi:N-acetylated-alpha-linked acidic dipeptidase
LTRPRAFLILLAAFVLFAGETLRPGAQQPSGQTAPAPLAAPASQPTPSTVFGFRDFTQQAKWDATFLAVPDAKLAGEHLKALTSAPHWASSPEDYATVLYVADHFKSAGLQTEIVPYSVLLNKPASILVEAFDSTGKKIFSGPTREHVELPADSDAERLQNDPRVLPGFNGSSPSGDVTAPVVYANYGRLADFERLAKLGISVKGKIVLVRYGANFRGVKVYIAQQYEAAGVLIYSDPADDGYKSGATYPAGPWRPDSAVQRGSVQFLPIYPGDPTTPGVASTPNLPASQRIPADKLQADQPSIPVNPISSTDAAPILQALGGSAVPQEWQGALPFPYHLGDGAAPVSVHIHLVQDSRLRTIWDVIGRIPGTSDAHALVIAGNHRDAWVYGAADPSSGTAAMLEAVHGLGVLLKQGWRPRRTIIFASWDAEEEGLVGSTEWVEQHTADLAHAVAYFNVDVAVSGPNFSAAAVPSLREFLRQIAAEVPSPAGGTVYECWKQHEDESRNHPSLVSASAPAPETSRVDADVHIGDLGSGSDYTPFLQHAGVPSTDIGSEGPFGIYHSVYDNYDWFVRFADPTFAYTQQQARIFGFEVLHMADADVLPFDYQLYAEEVRGYLDRASTRAADRGLKLDFTAAIAAAQSFVAAGTAVHQLQLAPPKDAGRFNGALTSTERALLLPAGLPRRPWYRHSVYAPGEFTGYAAVVIPGVSEGIEAGDAARAQEELDLLTQALERATAALNAAAGNTAARR